MTPKSFWILFIKIIGIWLVIDSFSIMSQAMGSIPYLKYSEDAAESIGIIITSLLIYFLILWATLNNTEWIIKKLNLDKGFSEEKFELNIKHSTVLSIATIVIGGLMFLNNIPFLLKEIFTQNQEKMFGKDGNMPWILFYFGKTFIGYLLVTNHQFVSELLVKNKNMKAGEEIRNDLPDSSKDSI